MDWEGAIMASITVRNLDDGLKRRLRVRAAENGRSMEQETRDIPQAALDARRRPRSETSERLSTSCSSLSAAWT